MIRLLKDAVRKLSFYKPGKILEFIFADLIALVYIRPIKKSYSQKGEDLILDRLLAGYKGVYVDVGANDPHRFSNTKRFYLRGWSGINIEPNPINYRRFQQDRARDTNINCGIAGSNRSMTFYVMFPDTLSTFSKHMRDELVAQGYVNEKILHIPVRSLADVLDTYCRNKKIAFFSIDTEGYDYTVLQSNDWKKFRPKLICLESGTMQVNRQNEKFLIQKGYRRVARTLINHIYADTHA